MLWVIFTMYCAWLEILIDVNNRKTVKDIDQTDQTPAVKNNFSCRTKQVIFKNFFNHLSLQAVKKILLIYITKYCQVTYGIGQKHELIQSRSIDQWSLESGLRNIIFWLRNSPWKPKTQYYWLVIYPIFEREVSSGCDAINLFLQIHTRISLNLKCFDFERLPEVTTP